MERYSDTDYNHDRRDTQQVEYDKAPSLLSFPLSRAEARWLGQPGEGAFASSGFWHRVLDGRRAETFLQILTRHSLVVFGESYEGG